MIGHVRLIKIDPEAETLGQHAPFLHITPDAGLALADERFDAVILDLLLAVDAEFFADFDFDGQAVRVPASFAFAEQPAHRFIARNRSLIARVKQWPGWGKPLAVGGPFEKDEPRRVLARFERLLVDVVLFPKLQDAGFEFRKTDLAGAGENIGAGARARGKQRSTNGCRLSPAVLREMRSRLSYSRATYCGRCRQRLSETRVRFQCWPRR